MQDLTIISSTRRIDHGVDTADRSLSYAESDFKIRFADSLGQRQKSGVLIKKMYGWRGYETTETGNDPASPPHQIILVASDSSGTLGTISLRLDSPDRLAADQTFGDLLESYRKPDRVLCELGKLAVDYKRGSKWVLASLFHIAYICGRCIHSVTDVFIEVNPRHVAYYQRMLGFTAVGEPRNCPRVAAPAVLLHLPLSYVDQQIALYGGRSELVSEVRSLYPYFFSAKEQEGILGRVSAVT
jgi:hypothetical protein